MKETVNKGKHMTTYIREFDSLSEFYDYIISTPWNDAFKDTKARSSINAPKSFSGTSSFEEAVGLFKNGWHEEAAKLTQKLNALKNTVQPTTKPKPTYSVQGFQCSVPRYLQGLPDSMINKKNVPVKQKVVTLTKEICYSAAISKETIENESVKALLIVQKLEAQGLRCNLNVIFASEKGNTREIMKVRIKSANERLNVSKQAFPLVHPSMLRRLILRYVEVAPTVTSYFTWGHGMPSDEITVRRFLGKDEYLIPRFIKMDVKDINSAADIK